MGGSDTTVWAHGGVAPFTPAALLTQAQPVSLLSLSLALVAWAYLGGVLRLSRSGTRWPAGRTVCFLLGLAVIASVTVSGLAAYDDVLLSAHMVQHMALGMIAPVFLALGAPVTLALRVSPLPARRPLLAVLHSRVARLLTFPIVSYGLFVASPFALYFTGLYRLSMEHDWVHELVHLHFVVVGCLFLWPLIGLDPLPGRMPYPLRALMMFLSTPFHTVLGLTVMQSTSLLGGDWYPSLQLGWADPLADQQVAGGILWAGGEFVSVTMLGALVVQWMRQSEREARRIDRELDRQEEAERRATASAAAAVAAPAAVAPVDAGRVDAGRVDGGRGTAGDDGPAPPGYDQRAAGPASMETPL